MSSVPQRARVGAYLIRRLHEDVISDFAKGQSQVDDVILGAAALREIADVHHSSSAGPLCKLLGQRAGLSLPRDISLPCPNIPGGHLPPDNAKWSFIKANAKKETHSQINTKGQLSAF